MGRARSRPAPVAGGDSVTSNELGPATTTVITRIELPWRTIVRVIMILVGIWLLLKLWSILLLLIVGLLLTAALDPVADWLERRGLSRGRAVGVIFFAMIGMASILLLLAIPPVVQEAGDFVEELPEHVQRTQGLLESRYPSVYEEINEFAQRQAEEGFSFALPVPQVLSAGAGILQGLSNTLIVLAITAYMLTGGNRIYQWSVRYLPNDQEAKVRQAIPEISRVVSGYVLGQLLLSTLFGIFTFIVLTSAGVPQALFLALVAAFMDAIPMIGVLLATIPAVLLALTVSVPAAIVVLAAYVIYQQIENYVIAPRVYRGRLQISAFAVLVAVLIGGELLGILGVLMALPAAAAIPVVERIWIEPLRRRSHHESTPPVTDEPSADEPLAVSR